MTRALSPETRAMRLVDRMEASGKSVARVIIEGDRVEIVLVASADPSPFDLVDMKR